MQKDFNTFQQNIGVEFNDLQLLRQAFTHRSYLNEHRGEAVGHNERLEFLGDAVLELIATHFLYEKFPHEAEGELTAYRAALVNAVTCAEVATEIGMNDFLLLSRGEAKDTGRARNILLANAFEALVGAIYLDQGYDAAQKFIGGSSARPAPTTTSTLSSACMLKTPCSRKATASQSRRPSNPPLGKHWTKKGGNATVGTDWFP